MIRVSAQSYIELKREKYGNNIQLSITDVQTFPAKYKSSTVSCLLKFCIHLNNNVRKHIKSTICEEEY